MSNITKNAIATSLKKIVEKKPLSRITVKEIVEDCSINRQTFYYHFKDIYDLIEWIYTSETTEVIADKKTYDNWSEGFYNIFTYIMNNKQFVLNTYHSISRINLEKYLYKEVYHLLMEVIINQDEAKKIKEEDKKFIANFYNYAFVGLVLEWIERGMKEDPNLIMSKLNILIQGDIKRSLVNFQNSYN